MKRTPRVCVTRNTPYYTQRIGEQSTRRCSLLFPHEGSKRVRKTALARGYACSSAFTRFAKQQYVSMYAALRRARNMKSLDIARTRRSKETYAILRYIREYSFFFFVYRKKFSSLRYYLRKYSFSAHFLLLILCEKIKANVIRCKKKLNMLARYIYIYQGSTLLRSWYIEL